MSRAQPSGLAALLRDFRTYAGAGLWLALTLMLLGALAEAFGLLMIVPLASVAIGAHLDKVSALLPWFSVLPAGHRFFLALMLFLIAMGLRSLLLYARDRQTSRLQYGYEASLRLRSAATLAQRGWSFASGVGQAGMQSLLLNDVPRAAQAIGSAQQAAVSAAMLGVQLALAAYLAPRLTAIVALFLLLASVPALRWGRRGVRSGFSISERMEESAGAGFRLHAGLKAALAQGTVAAFLDEYRSTLSGTADQLLRFFTDYSAAQQLASFAAAAAAALLLFLGVRVFALPFALLVPALIVFARMSGPAQTLQLSLQRAAVFAPAFAAMTKKLGELRPVTVREGRLEALEWRELALDKVSFTHKRGLGLAPLSMKLEPGQWLGVSGPSGCGKTTLVDIVAGLIEPDAGSISVDGKPLTGDTLERWRAGLAYVPQHGAVFNDSVRGNLLAEGAKADEADLWEALALVGLTARVRAFEAGLEEDVGDRGGHLSGGERQRLVLARALLRRPRLMILDEATAALDPEGERAVLERLRALEPRPAILLVAHRESSLAHCDSVLSIRH
jgi:ABC-type multidrug transport system fused ATPase/permease subunit